MGNTTIFDNGSHKNVLLEDFGHGLAVQANQHVIVDGDEGIILDPGGHKVYGRALGATTGVLGTAKLRYIFLSHQDPDIVAAVNGWLMTTDADAWISSLWVRFVPHFGVDKLVEHRLKAIPDGGLRLPLGKTELLVIPAHFLHSPGNFQVYDPVSKTLYSGDLGASLGTESVYVENFDEHVQFMAGFHRRYMGSNAVMRAWANMVRGLDIEVIAPQHGAVFKGKELCRRFIDWIASIECGVDIAPSMYRLPG